MKWPRIVKLKEHRCLHIEANGCIINIRENLTDRLGRDMTAIEIVPDKYSGGPKYKLIGYNFNRVIKLKSKNN